MIEPQTYSQIQSAIVTALSEAEILPTGAEIAAAPGALTEDWLSKNVLKRGAAYVAITGIRPDSHYSSGTRKHTLTLGIFLIPAPGRRDEQASALTDTAQRVLEFLDFNRFGLKAADRPEAVTARNAFSPSLDRKGSTLWLIDWRQTFVIFGEEEELPVWTGGAGG